jgi:hypothetical protein
MHDASGSSRNHCWTSDDDIIGWSLARDLVGDELADLDPRRAGTCAARPRIATKRRPDRDLEQVFAPVALSFPLARLRARSVEVASNQGGVVVRYRDAEMS